MKNGVLLLVFGVAAAGAAWVFWYSLGDYGALLLLLIAVVSLLVDDRRLRRSLREKGARHEERYSKRGGSDQAL